MILVLCVHQTPAALYALHELCTEDTIALYPVLVMLQS